MIAPHTLELTMEADKDTFNRWHEAAEQKKTYSFKKNKDYAITDDGVTIWFHKTEYKKKIKVLVNPSKVLGLDDLVKLWKPNRSNIEEFLYRLEDHIGDYFDAEYGIRDFKLSRIDFATNIRLDDSDKVSAYIRFLYNIRKVKGFSPKDWSHYDDFDSSSSFDLEGNSNGIDFTAYDKATAIKNQMEDNEFKRKDLKERMEKAKGILRAEVKLTTQKAISNYTDEDNTIDRIGALCEQSKEIFMETFFRVVPFGDIYKKDKVVKTIRENVTDKHLKRKMLLLVDLIHKKKSLHLAQKTLNDRHIDRIMAEFARHNVSPVTISKRHDIKHLKSLYTFI